MTHSQHTIREEAATTFADVWRWAKELEQLHARIAPHFARPEPRRRALLYLQGLLSPLERKNGWSLAEHAREASSYGMQRLLVGSVWDADRVRDDLRQYVVEQLGDPEAVLALDETSFPKRGDQSAGVQVQYCGTTGQVENCQVGVFLSYVTERSHTLIDRELYLPLSWTSDRQRCQAADIPDTVRFQTKCELAIQMLERAQAAQIPFAWVVADSVYGSNLDLRTWLEQHHRPYVLAVACDEPVGIRTADGLRRKAGGSPGRKALTGRTGLAPPVDERGDQRPQSVRLGGCPHFAAVGGGWTSLAALAPFPHRSTRPRVFLRLCRTGHHAGRDG